MSVQERQTREIGATAVGAIQARAGVLQGIDVSASLDAKASGESAHRVERQGSREESVPRVIPRPHGAWELSEPNGPDGCLDGDYLTSRGQYLDAPSHEQADLPLATVQTSEDSQEIAVELAIEIQPKDLVFHRIRNEGAGLAPRTWFQREKINIELIARRLIELTHKDGPAVGETKMKLGRAVLRGRRRVRAVREGS